MGKGYTGVKSPRVKVDSDDEGLRPTDIAESLAELTIGSDSDSLGVHAYTPTCTRCYAMSGTYHLGTKQCCVGEAFDSDGEPYDVNDPPQGYFMGEPERRRVFPRNR